MLKSLIRNRGLILEFWLLELKRRYAGTLLGPVWALLPPAMTIAAYWFVFEVGLKLQHPAEGMPFFFYFTLGMLPWFLFFDSFSTSVNVVSDNRHLITKMVFPSEILPVVNFLVAAVPHLFLLICLAIALSMNDLFTARNAGAAIYFFICTGALALGISWLVSSVCVFIKDGVHAATLIVGLFFWLTPIIWRMEAIPADWRPALQLNPLGYLTEGYRWALAGAPAPDAAAHMRFWIVTVLIYVLGAFVFNRLKPHFADAL